MLDLFWLFILCILLRNRRKRWNHIQKVTVHCSKIPFFKILFLRKIGIDSIFHKVCDHMEDRISHILTVKDSASFIVDDLSLFVHYLVIFKQVLTNTKVIALNLLLSLLNRT